MTEPEEYSAWRREFEGMPEARVRLLAEHDPSKFLQDPKSIFAKVWLAERADSKRDAREEQTLSIARRANTIAIIAMILATLTAIIAAVVGVMSGK